MTAIRARDEGGPSLACQVLIYPVTDADTDKPSYLANAQGYMLQRGSMQAFYRYYLNDPEEANDPRVSPLRTRDLSRLPPALVVTAEYDPLFDDGRIYAGRLLNAGVAATYSEYPGMIHGFLFMQGVLDGSKRLHDEIGSWVRDIMN